MDALVGAAKFVGGPGSIGFLLAVLTAAAAWGFSSPRRRRQAMLWMAIICAAYVAMALPVVATKLADGLPQVAWPSDAELANLDTLFILGGDNNIGRIRTAQRVYALGRPREVWLLGARFMVDDLVMIGAPRDRLHVDGSAANTAAQIRQIKAMVDGSPTAHVAILASRLQIGRVKGLAGASGLGAVLVPAELDREPSRPGLGGWLPSYSALMVSRDAIYEHAALAYYRARGQLSADVR